MTTLKETLSFENLIDSHYRCKRNVSHKDRVIGYDMNLLENITKLTDKIEEGTYHTKPTKLIQLYEPKKRLVEGQHYEDRIVTRSICDLLLYPTITKTFTTRNYACQKGRGVDGCILGFKKDLQRYYRKNKTNEGYVLEIDFRKYFEHINKKACDTLLLKHTDKETVDFLNKIGAISYIENGVGIRGGGQIQQLMGIAIPSFIDHAIEEKFGITCYARYQDDLRIVARDKEVLVLALQYIREEMNKLGIELHKKKTRIHKIKDGIPFLGKNIKLTNTGKVIITIKSSVVRRKKRKYKHMLRLACNTNKITFEYVDSCFITMLKSYSRRKMCNKHKRKQRYNTFYLCNNLFYWYKKERALWLERKLNYDKRTS